MVNLAERLGVAAELPAVPALVLGSGDVSPLDMAVGYSTFANRGVHNDPVMIAKIEQVDEDGDLQVLDQAVPSGDRVLSEEQADLVTYCLQEVVKDGTGTVGELRQAGRREDRHHAGQQGRLVRRLHAQAHRGGVDGLRRPVAGRHRADHERAVLGRPEPRAERRHRREPARRDLARSSCRPPPRGWTRARSGSRPRSLGGS